MKRFIKTVFSKMRSTPSKEGRLHALKSMSLEELVNVAQGVSGRNDNLDIRKAAIKLIKNPDVLYSLLQDDCPTSLNQAIYLQLAYLLDSGIIDIETLTATSLKLEDKISIVCCCNRQDWQNLLLDSVDDQQLLADICQTTTSNQVRNLVANKINDEQLLVGLVRALKNKDKQTYKTLKSTIDNIKKDKKIRQEKEKSANEICDLMQKHSTHVFDNDYINRLDRLQQRWDAVEMFSTEHNKLRFYQALSVSKEKINDHQIAEKYFIEEQKIKYHIKEERQKILVDIWQHLNDICGLFTINQKILDVLYTEQKKCKKRWQETLIYGEVSSQQNKDYDQLWKTIDYILMQFQESGSIRQYIEVIDTDPKNLFLSKSKIDYLDMLINYIKKLDTFKPDIFLMYAQCRIDNFKKNTNIQYEKTRKQVRIVNKLISQSQFFIKEGNIKKAVGICYSIDKKINNIIFIPENILHKQENLKKQVETLVDWKSYVVTPKKKELIKSMGGLVNSTISPLLLADQIARLQQEWRILSKGLVDNNEDLWVEFRELADQAYLPCKKYFRNISKMKESYLKIRKKIIFQLNDYYQKIDWEQVSIDDAQRVLSAAKNDFYENSNEIVIHRHLIEEFNLVVTKIYGMLDVKYEKNKAIKENFINQAKGLVEINNVEVAIGGVKRLQRQWKNIGLCSYKDDRVLRKEFNNYCNQVFDKKVLINKEKQLFLEENETKAKSLISFVDQYLSLVGEELLSVRKQCEEHVEAFNQLGDMPANKRNMLSSVFFKNIDAFNKLVSEQEKQLSLLSLKKIFIVLEQLNDVQYGLSKDNDYDKYSIDTINKEIAIIKKWPEGLRPIIKRRLNNIVNNVAVDSKNSLDTLTMLCIRAEILTGKESPEKDKNQRMQYQLELLQAGQTKSDVINTDEQLRELIVEWANIEMVEPKTYQVLARRFESCCQTLY